MQRAGVRRIFVTGAVGSVLGTASMDNLLQSVAGAPPDESWLAYEGDHVPVGDSFAPP